MRTCGQCSLCCKILAVEELNKPTNIWCKNFYTGEGCKVYDTRPQACKEFHCAWVLSDWMPDYMFPAKSKMFLANNGEGDLVIYIDESYPLAYKEGKIGKYVSDLMRKTWDLGQKVFLVRGNKRKQIRFL